MRRIMEEHVGRQFGQEGLIQRRQGARRGRLRTYPADQDTVSFVAAGHRHLAIELAPDVPPDGVQALVDAGQDAGDAGELPLGLLTKAVRCGAGSRARDPGPRADGPRLTGAPAEVAQGTLQL